ncbi:MAG: hypothetical protein O3A51_08795 [Verrucomicrobia bacterium]|nr:hypothetical protein [Verrucomicrobiota bacterium]
MIQRRRTIITIVVTIGLLGLWSRSCRQQRPDGGDEAPLIATCTRGTLTVTVSASGEIQTRDSHKIYPKIRQQATISYLVDNGARVAKGDVVARLNREDIDKRHEALNVQLEEKGGILDSRTTELEIQLIDNGVAERHARQTLDSAKQKVEQFLEGDRPLKRRNAALVLQNAASDLTRARKRHADLKGGRVYHRRRSRRCAAEHRNRGNQSGDGKA